jgi:hypothetical protein
MIMGKMNQLQRAGEIRLDDGVVWGRDATGRWNHMLEAIDIYDIRLALPVNGCPRASTMISSKI